MSSFFSVEEPLEVSRITQRILDSVVTQWLTIRECLFEKEILDIVAIPAELPYEMFEVVTKTRTKNHIVTGDTKPQHVSRELWEGVLMLNTCNEAVHWFLSTVWPKLQQVDSSLVMAEQLTVEKPLVKKLFISKCNKAPCQPIGHTAVVISLSTNVCVIFDPTMRQFGGESHVKTWQAYVTGNIDTKEGYHTTILEKALEETDAYIERSMGGYERYVQQNRDAANRAAVAWDTWTSAMEVGGMPLRTLSNLPEEEFDAALEILRECTRAEMSGLADWETRYRSNIRDQQPIHENDV